MIMKGPGCNSCPVNEFDCDAQYRGSRCSVLRDKYNLGDPDTKAEKLIKCDCNKCAHKEVCKWYEQERQQCGHYTDESHFIELPCKVGDAIYRKGRFSDNVIEATISQITINHFGFTLKATKGDTTYFSFNAEDIGKTVFLTPEAAEQALKEREKNV